ncbi:MAG: hypothetical protein ABUL60_02495 [Myxococcales bacterium]
MKLRLLTRVGFAVTSSALVLAACSDESPLTPGVGGTTTTGGTSSSGSTSGGSATAGSATAGSATAGTGTATAGTASAGTTGVSGNGGTSGGSGGTATNGGTAGTDNNASGASGEGGEGGEGGAGDGSRLLYDFETDVEGWKGSEADVIVASDATEFVTGSKSLKFTIPALTSETSRTVAVEKPGLWPGAVVTLHVWTPAVDGFYVQAYTQSNNWKVWDTNGNTQPITVVSGGWTTITYTVPQTFPGGLQLLGVQVGAGTGQTFAGADFYVDSVTVTGGVEECAGNGSGNYDFETAVIDPWAVDGNPASPADPDTVIAQSTTQANAGTGALKVSFTALPAGTVDAATPRRVFAYAPNAYCSDQVDFNVWTPTGSEALLFQGFSQSDNYGVWHADLPPATITRNGWTHFKYTIPAEILAGGIQRVGVQFLNTGAAFTGDVYIDEVSW